MSRRSSPAPAKGPPWKPPTSWLVSRAVVETVDGRVLEDASLDKIAHHIRCQVEKHFAEGARIRIVLEDLHG